MMTKIGFGAGISTLVEVGNRQGYAGIEKIIENEKKDKDPFFLNTTRENLLKLADFRKKITPEETLRLISLIQYTPHPLQ